MVILQLKNGGWHAFSVENFDGRVVFLDPQSGEANVDRYFDDAQGIIFLRTDNCDVRKTWRVEADG